MWTRIRLALARGTWAVAGGVGSPAVSIPLAGVTAAFLVAEVVLRSGTDGRWSLADTRAWWVLVWVVIGDSAVAVVRGLPAHQLEDGRLTWRSLAAPEAAGLFFRVGWLFAALAFLSSSGWRDRMEFRVAAGERFTASMDQLVTRDPLRYGSRGPFPVDLLVERVDGGAWAAGQRARAVLRGPDAGVERIGRLFPTWLGWGRYLRLVAIGPTLGCEVDRPDGGRIDRVAAKVALSGPTSRAEIRLAAAPLRVVVAPVESEPLVPGRSPSLYAWVHRGKLQVGEGKLANGAPLEADGVRVSFPEWSPWVQIEMVRDPGLPLALLAACFSAAALGLRLSVRRAGSGAGTGAET
jgi:hypothetical protein